MIVLIEVGDDAMMSRFLIYFCDFVCRAYQERCTQVLASFALFGTTRYSCNYLLCICYYPSDDAITRGCCYH